MKRLSILLVLVLASVACDITFYGGAGGNGTGQGNGTGTGSGNSPTSPTSPTPTPTPVPGGSGTRTPDPPVGTFLPFPTYTRTVVQNVVTPIGTPCLDFTYLDTVVNALRAFDTRWGYVCGSDCTNVRRDKIAYHAAAGPDTTGALGVWVVDIIVDACGPSQGPGFQPGSFDPLLAWPSRGRF